MDMATVPVEWEIRAALLGGGILPATPELLVM
jgi:hypothetical protein